MKEALLEKLLTPSMEAVDGVKLLYQHHFGCGHLLPSESFAAAKLAEEMEELTPEEAAPAFTLLGGGLCRLHLNSAQVHALGAELLARMMILTQQRHQSAPQNSRESFIRSLDTLQRLTREGKATFTPAALEEYLEKYRLAGMPMVSHSESYRQKYHPHYRVVSSDFALLLPVLTAVHQAMGQGRKALLVLDGPCGSGKSTLANLIARLFDAPVLPMDDFFLPPEMRTEARLSTPGGNIHHERILSEVIPPLLAGEDISYRRFDCSTGKYAERTLPAAPVMVVEGSYSLHPVLRPYWAEAAAITVCLNIAPKEQLARIAARDPELLPMFKSRWIPLEKKYFEAYDSLSWADIRLSSIPWEVEA